MAKPYVHAQSSVKKWGGDIEDYLPIHQHMDSSKSVIADNRHRALTHNSWYIGAGGPLELIFGVTILNKDGLQVSVRNIAEQHILEDFNNRFIPAASDYLQEMEYKNWMTAGQGEAPPSHIKIEKKRKTSTRKLNDMGD